MKQYYAHYEKWEDYQNGMWRHATKEDKEILLPKVIEFTGNHIDYGSAMEQVINKWRVSCSQNLTDNSINQKAWLGHAACNFKFGWNEEIVRIAWGHLTDDQRLLANAQADKYINIWKFRHTKNLAQLSLFE